VVFKVTFPSADGARQAEKITEAVTTSVSDDCGDNCFTDALMEVVSDAPEPFLTTFSESVSVSPPTVAASTNNGGNGDNEDDEDTYDDALIYLNPASKSSTALAAVLTLAATVVALTLN
jgi:hypothetical protein